MSDDLNNRGPQDAKLISLSEDWEVKYWTKTLACSVMELTAVVKRVGNSAEKVKKYLSRHKKSLDLKR
jgi:hypothetical protein